MTVRLRLWRRVRILPGVTLNISKRGVSSVSFGRRGMHYTVGREGRTRATLGLPGTGLFLTEEHRPSTIKHINPPSTGNRSWLLIVLLTLGLALVMLGGFSE